MSDTTKTTKIATVSEEVEKNGNNNYDEKIIQKNTYWFQYAIAFSASLLLMSSLTGMGWTSPTLPILLSPDSPIGQITSDESGWIVVAKTLGGLFTPIPMAYLMDKIGRKLTLILGAIPITIGWLLIAFSKSITWIYCARALQGATFSVSFSLIPMYLGEIASSDCRGSVVIITSIMNKLGYVFIYSIGPYVSMHTMAFIALILPAAFILTFPFMPESPYYLVGKNKLDKALVNLKRARGHKDLSKEFEQIKETVKRSQENRAHFMELFAKDNRRGVIIMIGLLTANTMCGGQTLLSYAGIVFGRVNSPLRASEASIILAVVQLCAAIVVTLIVDRVNRRFLLLTSCIGTSISNTVVFLYFLLDRLGVDVSEIGLVAVIALFFFIISYSMGLAGVSLMIIGEIFPKQLRSHAAAVFAFYGTSFGFGVGKLFQVISDNAGADVPFGIFAISCLLAIPFVYYILPETRGRTLDEIQELLKSRKIR